MRSSNLSEGNNTSGSSIANTLSQAYWARVIRYRNFSYFTGVWNAFLKELAEPHNVSLETYNGVLSQLEFRLINNPNLDERTKLEALEEVSAKQQQLLLNRLQRRENIESTTKILRLILQNVIQDQSYKPSRLSKLLCERSFSEAKEEMLNEMLADLDISKILAWLNANKIDAYYIRALIFENLDIEGLLKEYNNLVNLKEKAKMLICLNHFNNRKFIATLDQTQYIQVIDAFLELWHELPNIICTDFGHPFISNIFSLKSDNKRLYLFEKLGWKSCPMGTDKARTLPKLIARTNKLSLNPFLNDWQKHFANLKDQSQKFKLISSVIYSLGRCIVDDNQDLRIKELKGLNEIATYLKKECLLLDYIRHLQEDIYEANNQSVTIHYNLVHYVLISHLTCSQAFELFDSKKATDQSRHSIFYQNYFFESIPASRLPEIMEADIKFPKHFLFGDKSGSKQRFLSFEYSLALLAFCNVDDFIEYFKTDNINNYVNKLIDDVSNKDKSKAYEYSLHLRFFAQLLKSKSNLEPLLIRGEFLRIYAIDIFSPEKEKSPLSIAFYEEFLSVNKPGKAIEMLTSLEKVNLKYAFIFCVFQSFSEVEVAGIDNAEFAKFVQHVLKDKELFDGYFLSSYFKVLQKKYLKPIMQSCSISQAILILKNSDDQFIQESVFSLQKLRGRKFINDLFASMEHDERIRYVQLIQDSWFNDWDFNCMFTILNMAKKMQILLSVDMLFSICNSINKSEVSKHQFMYHAFLGGRGKDEVLKMFSQYSDLLPKKINNIINSEIQSVISCNFDYHLPIVDFVENYPKRWNIILVCKSWHSYYEKGTPPEHSVLPADILQYLFNFISQRTLSIGNLVVEVKNTEILNLYNKFRYTSHIREKGYGICCSEVFGQCQIFDSMHTEVSAKIEGDDNQKNKTIAIIIKNAICREFRESLEKQFSNREKEMKEIYSTKWMEQLAKSPQTAPQQRQ